jgi:hypothetical protein
MIQVSEQVWKPSKNGGEYTNIGKFVVGLAAQKKVGTYAWISGSDLRVTQFNFSNTISDGKEKAVAWFEKFRPVLEQKQ